MANVLLTDLCTRRCPYCFATKKLGDGSSPRLIDLRTLIEIADFLQRTGPMTIQLLGGEPTTHPDFALFLDYLLGRGFKIRVFTNAMIRARNLADIGEVIERHKAPPTRIRFIVNVNEPHLRSRSEWQLQTRAFRQLGEYAALSYNIHRADGDLDFLADIIERYGIQRYIRFGIAAPVRGEESSYLRVSDYRQAIDGLIDFARRRCLEAGIAGGLDCGFPLCFFDDEALGLLFRSGFRIKFKCGPAIDIDASKKAWHCFPLADLSTVELTDFPNVRALTEYFRQAFEPQRRRGGILPECQTCVYKARGICDGGCLAHFIDRSGDGESAPREP